MTDGLSRQFTLATILGVNCHKKGGALPRLDGELGGVAGDERVEHPCGIAGRRPRRC